MDPGQALVLVLSFPVIGIMLAILTALEKRLPRDPPAGPDHQASAEETLLPHSGAQPAASSASSPAPEAGGAHKQHAALRQHDAATPDDLPALVNRHPYGLCLSGTAACTRSARGQASNSHTRADVPAIQRRQQ